MGDVVVGVFHSVVEALQGACVESWLCPEPTDPVEVPKYDKGCWADRCVVQSWQFPIYKQSLSNLTVKSVLNVQSTYVVMMTLPTIGISKR